MRESVAFLAGIVLSSILLPLSLPLYRKLGVVDRPNARSFHTTAIPRGTGLVVVFAFVVVVSAYAVLFSQDVAQHGRALSAVLASVVLLAIVGFVDDMRALPTLLKFGVQIACAGLLLFADIRMPLPPWFQDGQVAVESLFTVLWIVGVVNAVNFIDGSDGLATTVSTLSMLLFAGISYLLARGTGEDLPNTSFVLLLGLAGAGTGLPFLLHNISPAKCFLGDAGSTFFGLLLGVLGILVAMDLSSPTVIGKGASIPYSYLLVPWLVLFVPVFDALRVTVDRILRGKSPFQADNRHLHHLLSRAGLSPNQILFLVALSVMIFGLLATILVRYQKVLYFVLGVFVLLVYGFFWFLKSSYRARRFVTLALNRRLMNFIESSQGYENVASFRERFEQELARVRRHSGTMTVVVVNAIGLKLRVKAPNPVENPRFLDNLLRSLRREDVKCRFSMDRLAFLLVETEKDLAGGVCDRIRAQFDAIRNGVSEGLQVGIGHASFPEDGGTVTALLQVAEARALADMSLPRAPRVPAHVPGEAVGRGSSIGGTNGTGPGDGRPGGEEGKPAGLPGWETDGEAKAAASGAAAAATEGLPAGAERRQRWAEASDKTLVPGSAASVKRWFQK